MEMSLTRQEPVDLGTVQNAAGTEWPARSLLSRNVCDFLGGL